MRRHAPRATRRDQVGTSPPVAILGRLVDVALLAVIAVGLSSVVVGRLLPILGHPVYVVAGPSMVPAIGVGSAVVLETVPASALAVGDVVSLRSGPARAVFTHRIVRIAEQDGEIWLETRGDANDAPDPSITPATAVIGRVTTSLPYAGYLIALLSTVPGLVLVLSTGGLLLALGWWLDALAGDRRRHAGASVATIVPVPSRASAPSALPEAIAVPSSIQPSHTSRSANPRRSTRPSTAARARAAGRGL
ncbi:MAG: signal peptidase I [Candidatus Limnocylindrales bacterium]